MILGRTFIIQPLSLRRLRKVVGKLCLRSVESLLDQGYDRRAGLIQLDKLVREQTMIECSMVCLYNLPVVLWVVIGTESSRGLGFLDTRRRALILPLYAQLEVLQGPYSTWLDWRGNWALMAYLRLLSHIVVTSIRLHYLSIKFNLFKT